jgi:biotin carboxyl carrier protein
VNLDITVLGHRHRIEVVPAGDAVTVRVDGQEHAVRLVPRAGSEWWILEADGRAVPVRLREEAGRLYMTDGAARVVMEIRRALPIPSRRSRAVGGAGRVEVRAPMPGLVVAVPVASGVDLRQGEAVAIIEAMKMQMEVPSPVAGRVEDVRVTPGQEVAGGQVLAVVAAASDTTNRETGL